MNLSEPMDTVQESLLTGIAIMIPAIITIYVLELAVGFLLSGISPSVRVALIVWPGVAPTPLLVEGLTVGVLAVTTVVLGFVVHFHAGEMVVRAVDGAIMRVPGVGTLYGGIRRIADTMLKGEDHSFSAVKLVEAPAADQYMLGFVVTESPTITRESSESDLVTLFVPLAPNPVMAGFVVHVPEEKLGDVDMTVEEGMSAIISLGATEEQFGGSMTPAYRVDLTTRE